eukprot:TRINITY_DN10616_c0_g1_i1.p1 TRINITY_DN10616_c0_g1~~TRINITY_DN10616_c0_g1_i1.p1  ORF type:complete len:619 (+),score=143.49 TRINITY_DN10616_c0_g1_i1:696-2552(+)
MLRKFCHVTCNPIHLKDLSNILNNRRTVFDDDSNLLNLRQGCPIKVGRANVHVRVIDDDEFCVQNSRPDEFDPINRTNGCDSHLCKCSRILISKGSTGLVLNDSDVNFSVSSSRNKILEDLLAHVPAILGWMVGSIGQQKIKFSKDDGLLGVREQAMPSIIGMILCLKRHFNGNRFHNRVLKAIPTGSPRSQRKTMFHPYLLLLLLVPCISVASVDLCPTASVTIVESIPIEMSLQTKNHTYDAWHRLFSNAKKSIILGEFYFLLTDGANHPAQDGGYMGQQIFQDLVTAGRDRKVDIRIVQNQPSTTFTDEDSAALAKMGIATVRSIDWVKLIGAGILHTKLIIIDDSHMYIGSANFDWTSLSQVKEIGIVIENCPAIVQDVRKIFEMYWVASDMTKLPQHWDPQYATRYNLANPMTISYNGQVGDAFVASSPIEFCASGRTNDIDALVSTIRSAKKTISIEVMDYSASSLYDDPNKYWPVISDALIDAAFSRGVSIRLLFSQWNYTMSFTYQWMYSLNAIDNIQVRLFKVPPQHGVPYVPYTRVNHAKFMVTDEASYIGTSNWSSDYFENTGGLSFNTKTEMVRSQMQDVFDRDWNSAYAHPLPSKQLPDSETEIF